MAPTDALTETRALRAVLWDADGVLQTVPGSWAALLSNAIGEDGTRRLLAELWPIAQEAIRGRGDLVTDLDRVLSAQGLSAARPAIREVWGTIERFDDSRALVSQVRRSVPCYLATNQDPLRARFMRERMEYDDLVDGSYYSCDLGAAKPDVEFFAHIAADLDLAPDELLFIDDAEENIVGARDAGLQAIHWHHRKGLDVLREQLADQGLI